MPRTSIVLPVRNGEVFLRASLDSLLAQTDPDFEIVVIDDGSADSTPAILRDYASRDRRLRLIAGGQGNLPTALNRGIAQSRGRYIARMDADDLTHPRRILLQADYLDRHSDIGLVASRVRYLGDANANRGLALFVEWTNSLDTPERIAFNRFVETPVVHPSVMFRRELIERHGGYRDGDFPEDYELWLRWMDAGVRFAKLHDVLLDWRDRPDRLTRSAPRYAPEAFFRVKAPYIARWLERHNPHHPDVVVWGAGRTARKRFAYLQREGIRPTAFIDIDPKKIGWRIGGVPVLGPDEIPEGPFVLIYVGVRGARRLIEGRLGERHYLPCA